MSLTAVRKKTVFTAQQKASLEAAYSGGLVKTGAPNSEAIQQLADELNLDVAVIKVSSNCQIPYC